MPPAPCGGAAVVVVTRLDDASADEVIAELNRRHVPVARLDPGDFPGHVTVNAEFGSHGLAGTLSTSSRRLDLSRVRSVYWRRPRPNSAPGTWPGRTPAGRSPRPGTGSAECWRLCPPPAT
ncbi:MULTISPECIES: MvdC/MvdD family ATP grasp protein [unclassified Streptomyces]|uniref:MvdC/MvdD family ATP grasp protein n=1 Tax=unclassified Streptomyces TaxID=2593676 RepID=UPI00069970DF|nr:hypothetical protein [Streptomyces sp. CNQ-509]